MKVPEGLSFAEAMDAHPWLAESVRRRGPLNYDAFVDQLYDDLTESARDLERHAQTYVKQSEDQITEAVCRALRMLGYVAKHDSSQSGHVDVWVQADKYQWIGEAKIFRAIDNMREGMRQLVTRYTGAAEERRSALFAYVQKGVTTNKLDSWMVDLSKGGEYKGLSVGGCERRPEVAFVSTHTHATLGLQCEVWHLFISLQHEPRDKSARARQQKEGD